MGALAKVEQEGWGGWLPMGNEGCLHRVHGCAPESVYSILGFTRGLPVSAVETAGGELKC